MPMENKMDLVDIVITAQLIASPVTRKDKHLIFSWLGPRRQWRRQCMMSAQPEIAKWIGDHPAYFTARWRCENPDKRVKDI
jgi:hypothetical protein